MLILLGRISRPGSLLCIVAELPEQRAYLWHREVRLRVRLIVSPADRSVVDDSGPSLVRSWPFMSFDGEIALQTIELQT